ncbi:unnamed protein product [Lampetra fluviatilis]
MPPAVCPTRDPEENPGLPSRYLPIAAATGENERLEGSEEQLTGQGARAKVGSEIQPKTQPRQPAEGGPGWSHQDIYKEMVEVFDPPSGARQKLKNRQWEVSKSLLVFRMELLTLAEATFPRLNEPGLVVEEEARTSLWVARHLCAYEEMAGPTRSVEYVV